MHQKRSQWASNVEFILAAAGSAVGLGNIWKFPGKVGAYGGGAFILCYMIIVALIGFPVMLAELSIGRKTQKNVIGAFRQLDKRFSFVGGGNRRSDVLLQHCGRLGVEVYLGLCERCAFWDRAESVSDVFYGIHSEAGGTAALGSRLSSPVYLCGG